MGEGEAVDCDGPGLARGRGAGAQGRAGGADIVNHQQRAACHCGGGGKCAVHVDKAFAGAKADLLAGGAGARQPIRGQGQASGRAEVAGQQVGLVIAALGQPRAMQRRGYDRVQRMGQARPVGSLVDGDQVARQQGGQVRLLLILERMDGFAQGRGVQRGGAQPIQRVVAQTAALGAGGGGRGLGAATVSAQGRGHGRHRLRADIAEARAQVSAADAGGRKEQVQPLARQSG